MLLAAAGAGCSGGGGRDTGRSDGAPNDQPAEPATDQMPPDVAMEAFDGGVDPTDAPKEAPEAPVDKPAADVPPERPSAACSDPTSTGKLVLAGDWILQHLSADSDYAAVTTGLSAPSSELSVVALADGSVTKIGADPGWAAFALGPGSKVLHALLNTGGSLFTGDLVRWTAGGGVKTLATGVSTFYVRASLDGSAAAYVGAYDEATDVGDLVLWRDGAPSVTLASKVGSFVVPRFSADGKYVAASVQPDGATRSQILLAEVATGVVKTLSTDATGVYQSVLFTADSKYLVYVDGYKAAGSGKIVVHPVDGATPDVTDSGTYNSFVLSGDGSQLVYVGSYSAASSSGRLRRLTLPSGTPADFGTGPALRMLAVAPDGSAATYGPVPLVMSGSEVWLQTGAGASGTKLSSNGRLASYLQSGWSYFRKGAAHVAFSDAPDTYLDVTLKMLPTATPGAMPTTLSSGVYYHEPDYYDDKYLVYSKNVGAGQEFGDMWIANVETGATAKVAACVAPLNYIETADRRLVTTRHASDASDGLYLVPLPSP